MDRELVYIILVINLIASLIYFDNKKCEIPLFLAVFNMMVEYRIIALKMGYGDWVNFDYGIQLSFNYELAYAVSDLIVLGSSLMIYSYMLFYEPGKRKIRDSESLLGEFVLANRNIIIGGFLGFTLFQTFFAGSISEGYGNLFKLGNSSFIIFIFLLAIHTDKKKILLKTLYFLGLAYIGYITYGAALRFQFLGWMFPLGYYITRNIKPMKKVGLLVAGLFVIMILFSGVRQMQYMNENPSLTWEDIYDASVDRMMMAEDVNFIDGFIMMYQVYPNYLDYEYGLNHLNIIFRPIPRVLWPGKPLAGWFQQLADKYHLELLRIGFSPTIYGVFYAEGGVVAIIILSVAWAWFLSYLYRSFSGFNSDLSAILLGVLLTCLIPVFRSGDLPGDIAIVLMSYWPVIVFVYLYKRFLVKKLNER